MKQIKVRRGIDIAQNLFQNINFNRGRSQPPRTKEPSLKQQSEGKQEQKQQEGQTNQQQSPRLTDQKLKGGAVGSSHGSKSIILEQMGSSKSGAVDSSKHSGALHESQLQRLGINQSVAQIHTLSQLNSERGSVHDHHLPGNQRPSAPPFSPQRAVRNSQRPMGLFDRLSSIHRSNTSSHKQKGGSSVQPTVRNHAGTESQPTFNLHQDQITVLSSKRNTRNFESKLGQAIKNIEGGPAVYREQYRKNATESQLMTASAQQKIVNVANYDKTMESYVNSQGRNKKSKRGQKAVVQKYQQIPQSMISSNRPTFQQLEKAQSISNISSISDKMQINNQEQQHDNEKGINHIRQYYQDENYRSSPGGQKAAEMKKFRVAVGGHAKGNSIIGLEHDTEGGKGSAKVPSSSEKPKTKVQFKSKPPQLATGDERDYQSPQFSQAAQSQNHSVERPRRFGSDVTDIESQSQHMSQWRRNQFPQDQSSHGQGVQHYKVVNFRPYQEEVESLKVNNTNMAADNNAAASSKRTSKQSISSPKPAFPQQQASSQTTEKPRTQSYYQRILNQIKRSPKSRSNEQQIQFREGEQAGANESASQQQHSTSGIVQDPADIPELQIHLSNSSNLTQMKKHNIEKIPQKHRSAVQFQQVQTPCFQNQGKHRPLMDSQMKTIPIELIPDKTNSHIDGEEQRVSDLFSPARGKMDGKHHQQHNTMTHSQIQNLKNSSEGLKNFTIDINNDVNRRYTKPSMAQDKNALRVEKQGSDNQSQVYQQARDVNDYYGAQSVAMSPSARVRMYDEMINTTPQTVNQQSNLQLHQQASAKSGPFHRYRKQQSEERLNNSQTDDNNRTGNSDQNPDGARSSSKPGGNYSLFNFRRKQGALKSNERQQSPRASSKQILAKQNLSRLTKPFSKNRAAEKSVSGQHGASSGVFELDNRSKEDSNRKREFKPVGSLEQLKRNSKENKAPTLRQGANAGGESLRVGEKEEHHQSSILFGSSRDSCDIEATGSKAANKTVRIISDSCSPQRPAVTKFKHKTEGDGEIERQTGGHIIGGQEDRGANADLRMRNKKNIMSNIKQVHQNYKNNKLKKMDNHNNANKLVNKQQSDTPPRKHGAKFSMDVSDPDCVSGEDGLQKVRTTMNSSKLKDQETASGATKQNSAYLQSSIQGQQIGDGALDEKDGGDDKDAQNNNMNDDPDQEVKGWTIFKLKSWKNIFVKSNEKGRENDQTGELNKTGENNDTKEEEAFVDKDTTQHLKVTGDHDDVDNEASKQKPKDAQVSSSSQDQVVMELKEMKHNIQCDCDKDATYCFACKNGVVWFAANVIALKIRRQQKLNDKVDVSKIILEEYEKCKKHYKSLKKLKPKQESALQIDRDLGRTFPKNQFFNPGQPGYRKLRNVLRAFSCYDDQADYVQGMNFLVGQLLMHCSATLAFWLFVELIEECELRDIYQVGLPGLHKHSFIINMLVKDHLPELHRHFEEHNVVPEMYASDWIFGLFASILPENQTNVTAHFFSLFFQYKWEFFYKLILSILEQLKPKLMEAQDMFSILQQIKIAMSNKNDPYTYGLIYQQEQQMQGQQKNRNKYTDHEMEDILGSIVSGQEEGENQTISPAQQSSLFSNIANFFKKSKDEGDREPVWQEFPWEQVIVKTDIIQKWKKVDMKKINRLHANFDLDTGKFVNIEEERQQQEQQAKLGAAIATSLDKHQFKDKE